MRTGDIVGGVALAGLLVLLGLALSEDRRPAAITPDTSPFVFASTAPTTAVASSVAVPPATTSAPPAAAPTSAAPPAAAPPATNAALLPPEARAAVQVRVLNGGAPAGSAAGVTDRLRAAGFTAAPPTDTESHVDADVVLFGPRADMAAATVSEVLQVAPDHVVPGGTDPNWSRYGGQVAVLVVLGPGQP
jgi:hypothetical protein